jgi:hypothetical protein
MATEKGPVAVTNVEASVKVPVSQSMLLSLRPIMFLPSDYWREMDLKEDDGQEREGNLVRFILSEFIERA